jgi:hypothetical protein
MGEHKQATTGMERLLEKDGSALACYNAACVFALSASTSGLDSERAAQYAARAMELVRKAVDKGYPDPKEIMSDQGLLCLRERADFKQLLSEVEKKTAGVPKPQK